MSSAHGWPDDETRPLPYGAVLASGTATLSGPDTITVTDLPLGAWRSVALMIDNGGVQVALQFTWDILGQTTAQAFSRSGHPADGSLLVYPVRGHKLAELDIAVSAAGTVTYVIMGSNLDPSAAQRPQDSVVRLAIGNVTGPMNFAAYLVPVGFEARVLRFCFTLTLVPDPADPLTPRQWGDAAWLRASQDQVNGPLLSGAGDLERQLAAGPTANVVNNIVFAPWVEALDADIGDNGTGAFECNRGFGLDDGWLQEGTFLMFRALRSGEAKTPTGTGWWPAKELLAGDALTHCELQIVLRPLTGY